MFGQLMGLGTTGGNMTKQTGGASPKRTLRARPQSGWGNASRQGVGSISRGKTQRRPQKVSRFRGRGRRGTTRRRGGGNLRRLKGLVGGAQAGGNMSSRVSGRGTVGRAAGRGTVAPKRNNLHQIASQLRGAF